MRAMDGDCEVGLLGANALMSGRVTVSRHLQVVVAGVVLKHDGGEALVDDQEAVEEFAAEGVDEAFGDRVRPRCPALAF